MAHEAAGAEGKARGVNSYHLFTPPASRPAWEARAAQLREQILFSAGLWPMPAKGPLEPRVTGQVEGPDYVIENVALRTMPGLYLCGNLYRPKGRKGPFPTIVNPHGHWENGRLATEPDVPLAEPPPAPPAPGRGNLVAIGVNLARQGFVVFAYDMLGYNDTRPLTHEFAGGVQPWLHGISLMGVQLWNSIRAVDYLASLRDVDPARIGATGASGGGTQTFLLCAVDDRIRAAVPVNMISAQMQGGCLCENGPGLRLGTDNVEIGATFAPKPLLLVACTGDWTKQNPSEEWPVIRRVYDLYGAGDRTAVRQFNYKHNYNVESREAMYAWFGRWLQNDPDAEHFREQPFTVDVEAMRVWNSAHPLPADALAEPEMIRALIDAAENQLARLWPKGKNGLRRFRELMTPALGHALGVPAPSHARGGNGASRGKRALVVALETDREAEPRMRAALNERGYQVESLGLPPIEARPDALWAEFYTGYNRTPLGDCVQAIVEKLTALESERQGSVDVVGLGKTGLWTLLARGLAPGSGHTAVDVGRFDDRSDQAYVDGLYAPGLRRAGDLRTAALLSAPAPLCLFNAGTEFQSAMIAGGFRALEAPLRIEQGALSESEIASWLGEDRR
jgi:Acetyl xylan esterase (AXE1)